MSVDLSLIIADLENKITAADSNTPLLDLLQMITAAERLTGGKNVYDSVGEFPTGAQYEGSIAFASDGNLRLYNGTAWDTLDSSSYSPPFGGEIAGYHLGGLVDGSPAAVNVIQRYSFTTDENSIDVGDLEEGLRAGAGQQSKSTGFHSGGTTPAPVTLYSDKIQKFPFAASASATDVANLAVGVYQIAGQSSSTHGYASGGLNPGNPTGPTGGNQNIIQKFAFSSTSDATDIGDLTYARRPGNSGQSSSTHGYTAGGVGPAITDTIDKFSFTTDGNATDVGNTTLARQESTGQSSDTHGYASGGHPYDRSTIIDKFSFSTDGDATDVGDLSVGRRELGSSSSTTEGYSSGGFMNNPTTQKTNVIDKFPFASDANATDVGDLLAANQYGTGVHV